MTLSCNEMDYGTERPTMSVRSRTKPLTTEHMRKWVIELVEKETLRTMSRMKAYENVAAQIGASPAWVRRVVKGYEGAGLSWAVGRNIYDLYLRVCISVEQAADRKERNNASAESGAALAQSVALAAPASARIQQNVAKDGED